MLMISEKPRMAFSGVRSSWLIPARNELLARGASSGPGEGPARRGRRPEPAAGHREHGLLRLLAQAHAVEELAAGEPVERRDRVADRVARFVRCGAVV